VTKIDSSLSFHFPSLPMWDDLGSYSVLAHCEAKRPCLSVSRCYVDQQIGPTLSSRNRRRSSELRQSWATVVELGWNNSRTRVGVAELSAGRVAWARDAEAMSRLGNYSDFVL